MSSILTVDGNGSKVPLRSLLATLGDFQRCIKKAYYEDFYSSKPPSKKSKEQRWKLDPRRYVFTALNCGTIWPQIQPCWATIHSPKLRYS